jgi:NTP pyrophosphatase (non-canonical NTP hydrolase)
LAEECGEVIKAAMKILRHGYGSTNPDIQPALSNNRGDLMDELGHVEFAVHLLVESGDLSPRRISISAAQKKLKVQPYLHHNEASQ